MAPLTQHLNIEFQFTCFDSGWNVEAAGYLPAGYIDKYVE